MPRKANWNKKGRVRNKEFVQNFLKTHPCVDCGETDIIVLEFDHVRGVKLDSISGMVRDARSLKAISDEIAKCEVRCANCHRRKTVTEREHGSRI